MSDSIETRIQHALDQIKTLLGEITPLRERAGTLAADLGKAKALYNEKLRPLKKEGDELRSKIMTLNTRRAGKTPRPVTGPPKPPEPTGVRPPKPFVPVDTTKPPSATPRNFRLERKRALHDHVSWVMGHRRQKAAEMQEITALLADESADVGDMLELIPWGEEGRFWKERPTYQKPEEQAAQLEDWVSALQGRLSFWKNKIAELQEEATLAEYAHLMTTDLDKQRIYLEEEMKRMAAENQNLATQASELERMIQTKEA